MAQVKTSKGRMKRAAQRLLRRKGGTPEQSQRAQRRLGRKLRAR